MRALLLIGSLSVLLLAGVSAELGASPPPAPAYRIVVHPSNPAGTIERRVLEDAFLKKVKTWPNGETIRPVDLESESPVRQRFSEEILRRPVDAVRAYWQQNIFSGRDLPPPELDTDEDVLSYVSKYPGAVGYVSGHAALRGVKAVSVQ
jgi:ABC-type phosphate transport system substrate-binding protein